MKNVLHRLRSLNVWSPAGRSVVLSSGQFTGPLGDRDLPEDVHHWGAGLRVHSLTPLPVRFPFFLSVSCVQVKCDLPASGLLLASCSCYQAFPAVLDPVSLGQ